MRRLIALLMLAVVFSTPAAGAQRGQPVSDRNRALIPYKLGFENMRAEAWAEAAKSFQAAIDIDSSFEMAYYMLGRVRMAQKQFVEAVIAFTKARELYLTSAGRQFATAQDAQRARRDSMTEIDEVIRQVQASGAPTSPQVQDQLRMLQERRRQLQENIQRGNNMAVDASIPVFVSLSLGSAYFRSGNLQEAERYYKEAITADPKAAEAHNNLAVVYLTTGRASDAEREVSLAEKAGFRVNPQLKDDIAAAKKKTFE